MHSDRFGISTIAKITMPARRAIATTIPMDIAENSAAILRSRMGNCTDGKIEIENECQKGDGLMSIYSFGMCIGIYHQSLTAS